LLFSNVHIIHNYYQASNQIFLLMALSVATASLLESGHWQAWVAFSMLTVIMIAWIHQFSTSYLKASTITTNTKLVIGQTIKSITQPDEPIIVFGDYWSSEIPFHSERRSLNLPRWGKKLLPRLTTDPEYFLGGQLPGAVIYNLQPTSSPVPSLSTVSSICPSAQRVSHGLEATWGIYRCQPNR
jgi:hypothetical protein